MDQNATLAANETPEMALLNGNEAMKTVVGMLGPATAAETASFMVDTSLQFYPEAMRGRPDTPAATSLREHHFTVLMAQVASAYAEGRGQDFADGRCALDHLLQEDPEHQQLAMRFRKLMGLWLHDEYSKRQQAEFEREQRKQREEAEREEAENDEQSSGEKKEVTKAIEDSPSSTASADSQRDSKAGGEVQGSPTGARAKSVFDLSGLVDTDEDESSSDDEDSSSDEEITRI